MKNLIVLLLLLLLLFFSTVTRAQVQNASVTYSFKLTEDKGFQESEVLGEMYKSAMEGAKDFEFVLNFNSEESHFKMTEMMDKNSSNANFGKAFSGYSTPIYTNRETRKQLQYSSETFFPKNEYVVEEPMYENWTMTTETKLIDNYLCYKAEGTHTVVTPKGTFIHPVTAWYCPKIPFPFGPNGYGNLPGLILELQVRNVVFGAKTIVFNLKEKLEILRPSEGKMISNEEYGKKIKEASEKMFGSKN